MFYNRFAISRQFLVRLYWWSFQVFQDTEEVGRFLSRARGTDVGRGE